MEKKKIFIFGTGNIGKKAFLYFQRNRVNYFVDNYNKDNYFLGKKVISLPELIEMYDNNCLVIVAIKDYRQEVIEQLKKEKINNYFIFDIYDLYNLKNVQPGYWLFGRYIHPSYAELLANFRIEGEEVCVVFDKNTVHYGAYLLIELQARCGAKICFYVDIDEQEDVIQYGWFNVWDRIKSIDDLKGKSLIINAQRHVSNIRMKLHEQEKIIDLFDVDKYFIDFNHPELEKYHNIHKEKRCFVIGTGPSLRIDDLEVLKKNKEICIACNKIYRIYNQTEWRADYYGFLDGRVIEDCIDDIKDIPGEVFMGDSYHYDINPKYDKVQYFHYIPERYYPNYPRFSDDFTKGFYEGRTTTYSFGIQLAAYMGFSEIYLLGVDNTVIGNITDERNHFIKDYFKDEEKELYHGAVFNKDVINKAYEAAEYYSRKKGFRIFNATRGGELEVFERVDFDEMFFGEDE